MRGQSIIMEKLLFSIVVPFYNQENTIRDCVQSLLNQDFPKDRYELIFVDNNSSDGSVAIVRRYPEIRLFRENMQGAYAARNTGVINAGGLFIVFTDADAQAPAHWLTHIEKHLQDNDYDILLGWYSPRRHIKIILAHDLLVCERIETALRHSDHYLVTACAANLVIKKEVLAKEGLFIPSSNSEDMYFTMRCMQKGYRIGFKTDINVKRLDIDSVSALLVKNFVYGCSNAVDIKLSLPLAERIKALSLLARFMLRRFPLSLGAVLFSLSYKVGYLLGRLKIINESNLFVLVHRYTKWSSRKQAHKAGVKR